MATLPRSINRCAGFTLAEMAIVVLLIGILMTAGVGMLSSQLESSAVAITAKRQDNIKEALIAYLGKNKRLPCPDNPAAPGPNVAFDGIEDRTGVVAGPPPAPTVTTACVNPFGTVPYVTLGLSRDTALDGWNNFFSYHVSDTPYNWTLSNTFNAGSQGGLTINRRTAAGVLIPPPANSPAVVVVVSHGKNGSGAYTVKGSRNTLPAGGTDELINTNGSIIYYQREYTNSVGATGGPFDDMVMVLQTSDLISPALASKTLRSFDEEVSLATKDIEDIKSALTGFAMRNDRLPNADSSVACAVPCIANDGLEDAGVYSGNIPWQTLGVAANDPWATTAVPATPYQYRVTPYLTIRPSTTTIASPNGFSVGAKNFTVQPNLGIPVNSVLVPSIIHMEDPTNAGNFLEGTVTAYNNGTGALTLNVPLTVPPSFATTGPVSISTWRSSFKRLTSNAVGNINVWNDIVGAVPAPIVLMTNAPFVVFSRGRNNVAYFGAQCTGVAPVAPNPPTAPNCLGGRENANRTATGTAALHYVKAPLTVPPFVAPAAPDPRSGFDDLLDYVSKSVIDAKLP